MAEPTTPEEMTEALRELWLTDSDLSYLTDLEPETLAGIYREVRAHATRTHEQQRSLYATLAATTRLIPNALVVRLSSGLSPYVLAQVSEYLEPKAAAALAKAFGAEILSEIVLHIDTRTAARIAVHMELEMLVRIVDSLASKGLNKRLGEIADALEEKMLEKLVRRIEDPRRTAAIACHMQALDKLSSIARRLDPKVVQTVGLLLERDGHAEAARALRA